MARACFAKAFPSRKWRSSLERPTYLYSRASIEQAYRRMDSALRLASAYDLLRRESQFKSGYFAGFCRAGQQFRYRFWRRTLPLAAHWRAGRAASFFPAWGSRAKKSAKRFARAFCCSTWNLRLSLTCSLGSVTTANARCGIDSRQSGCRGRRPPAHLHRASPPQVRHRLGTARDACTSSIVAHAGSSGRESARISVRRYLTLAPYRRALARLAGFVRDLGRAGIALRYLDCGGGLGIRYTAEQPPDKAAYAAELARAVASARMSSSDRARTLAGRSRRRRSDARAVHQKKSGRTFVVVDAAMNDFMRPALYDATHPITRAHRSSGAPQSRRYRRSGLRIRRLLRAGLASGKGRFRRSAGLVGSGAYGFVEASNYNSRPRPAEVLVTGRRFRVIRRRESRADLVRGE